MMWLDRGLMAAFLLVLLLIAIPSVSGCFCQCDNFKLEIENPVLKIAPGSTADIYINVKNKGTSIDDAKVMIVGPDLYHGRFKDESGVKHFWKSYFPNGIRKINTGDINPGEDITLHLKVEVPPDEDMGIYKYIIKLRDKADNEDLCSSYCGVEVDRKKGQIELIPEFSTIAVPAGIAIITALYFFRRQ